MNNQIYMIFYDRCYRAQDNGEHLCRWVMNNHPEIKAGYLLDSNSYDWDRLKAEGFHLIDTLDHELTNSELQKCDYACSSIFTEGTALDFTNCKCKRIFLNHGCFLVPINYIKKEHENVDLFIAANQIEYNNFLDSYHELRKEQVALCGQPRQDSLVKSQLAEHEENTILIQFWQRPAAWTTDDNAKFLKSDFYKKTCALLSNKTLLQKCHQHNLTLVFKMHSIQYDWLKYYKDFENEMVRLSPLSELFEDEFIKSKLIITDISSNAYEMAKIGKPCIYFEPDPEFLFGWRYKKNGGFEFNLEKDSIGPVIYNSINEIVIKICETIDNNFELDQLYRDRRIEQIAFMLDENNCERCFDAIMHADNSARLARLAGVDFVEPIDELELIPEEPVLHETKATKQVKLQVTAKKAPVVKTNTGVSLLGNIEEHETLDVAVEAGKAVAPAAKPVPSPIKHAIKQQKRTTISTTDINYTVPDQTYVIDPVVKPVKKETVAKKPEVKITIPKKDTSSLKITSINYMASAVDDDFMTYEQPAPKQRDEQKPAKKVVKPVAAPKNNHVSLNDTYIEDYGPEYVPPIYIKSNSKKDQKANKPYIAPRPVSEEVIKPVKKVEPVKPMPIKKPKKIGVAVYSNNLTSSSQLKELFNIISALETSPKVLYLAGLPMLSLPKVDNMTSVSIRKTTTDIEAKTLIQQLIGQMGLDCVILLRPEFTLAYTELDNMLDDMDKLQAFEVIEKI